MSRVLGLGCFAVALGVSCPARAEVRMAGPGMRARGGIRVEVAGPYENLPPSGWAPLRVVIDNPTGRAGTWAFDFHSSSTSADGSTLVYSWSASVAAREEQRFDVCVPLNPIGEAAYEYQELAAFVRGPGVESGHASYPGRTRYTGHPRTPFAGVSRRIADAHLGALETELDHRSWELRACPLVPDELFPDWRGYLGFGSVWMAEGDWAEARASVRAAILRWVAHGGALYHVSANPTAAALRAAGIPADGESEIAYGAGWVSVLRDRPAADQVATLADRIVRPESKSLGDRLFADYQQGWPLLLRLPESELKVAPIILAMLVFAVIVGPLNLAVLAGKTRRHRLFVTTPVISLAASLLLGGLILIQDGTGGIGGRVALIQMDPDGRQVLFHQEQISRTGVLLGQRFALADDVHITSIHLPTQAGRRDRTLRRDAAGCDGEWFASRSWQAHYLTRAVPSRGRVELHNPTAVRSGDGAPVLLSTLPQGLEDVFYFDPRGNVWHVPRLRVGERVEMEPSNRGRFLRAWWSPRIVNGGIRAGGRIDRLNQRSGYVYAGVTADAPGVWIETHPAVRWQEQTAVAIGPCHEVAEAIR